MLKLLPIRQTEPAANLDHLKGKVYKPESGKSVHDLDEASGLNELCE